MADLAWLSAQYLDRRRAAESHVTKWLTYSDRAHVVDPLYFLVHRCRPGRPVEDSGDVFAWYGVDDAGLVWVEREATGFEDLFYETFLAHGPFGPTEAATFSYRTDEGAVRHEVFGYEDGRLATATGQARWGCTRTRYLYESGRLTGAHDESGPSLTDLKLSSSIVVSYDDVGEIAQVTREWSTGDTVVAYRALPAGTSVEDLARSFVDHLVASLPAAVAADPPTVSPACLVLLYLPGQFETLPPTLAFPTTEGTAGIAGLLKDRELHEVGLDRDDHAKLHELAGLLDQQPLDDHQLRATLNEACRRLNAPEWRRHLGVPDDFLAFAADLDLCDLAENLDAVTTPERAARILSLVE